MDHIKPGLCHPAYVVQVFYVGVCLFYLTGNLMFIPDKSPFILFNVLFLLTRKHKISCDHPIYLLCPWVS